MANEPNKPDFSNVESGSQSSAPKVDFGNVKAGAASTATRADSSSKTYTVASGDSLSRIAKHVFGDANRWHEIFEANRDQLDNPDLIQPGQVLKIPAHDHSNNGG
jgi:nucleoid-associated protein YgaU